MSVSVSVSGYKNPSILKLKQKLKQSLNKSQLLILYSKYYDNMFDFQKLTVYQKARHLHKDVIIFLQENKSIPLSIRDQLSRAAFSVMLNIAEGAGRFTKPDKSRFYIQSRSSVFETVACFEACIDLNHITETKFSLICNEYEDISKMLFSLIDKK